MNLKCLEECYYTFVAGGAEYPVALGALIAASPPLFFFGVCTPNVPNPITQTFGFSFCHTIGEINSNCALGHMKIKEKSGTSRFHGTGQGSTLYCI